MAPATILKNLKKLCYFHNGLTKFGTAMPSNDSRGRDTNAHKSKRFNVDRPTCTAGNHIKKSYCKTPTCNTHLFLNTYQIQCTSKFITLLELTKIRQVQKYVDTPVFNFSANIEANNLNKNPRIISVLS